MQVGPSLARRAGLSYLEQHLHAENMALRSRDMQRRQSMPDQRQRGSERARDAR